MSVMDELMAMIAEQGWRGTLVPVERLAEVETTIEGYHENGSLDDRLYDGILDGMVYEPPEELPEARSIVIVAVPVPPVRIFFHRNGESIPVVVPPTYTGYMARTESVRQILGDFLEGNGHRLAGALLPLKTLAVRSGLAEYGRNNICYVDRLGSHLQLVGAFTDLPCEDHSWRRPEAMDLCSSCEECLRNCPTGAIIGSRFLLHAEICLTFHNENPGEFADWIKPEWHHCLIGCMRCQEVCPMNSDVAAGYDDLPSFTASETDLLIGDEPFETLPGETTAKLSSMGLTEDPTILRRNLRMLFRND